ncbi:hypothetical protein [Cytobacillus gottheilii]|uniref:DUF7210 domain-containing protein n=1 Tax=Cytobacillus gottheilii TaxID=859144 RepID=A0ABX8FAT2_9BACI|nr:hypothetical protein [Cytobacillus gottheilii]QVY60938.1 hypothetical protein J1899_18495 [Cytobacillus gottheilii]
MTEEQYNSLNVNEVLEVVQKAEITAEEALAYESQGKKRKTLLDALNDILESNNELNDSNDNSEDKPKLTVVSFNKNVKFGTVRYKKGEKTEVTEEDYDYLLKGGLINEG